MADFLEGLFAPWARWYGDSTLLATLVGFVHLAGVLWGGGRAVVADAVLLRARDPERFAREGQLAFLVTSHRDVLIGLGLVVVSGLLLFGADVRHYFETPLYWLKMAAVVLLLLNGWGVRRTESLLAPGNESAARAWRRARLHASASLGLWFVVVLLGQGLVNL